jgi:2-polyprenyl-6-hydroxyphenyl methylase/3-demethylubiquinone-9 3-methyltransferase
VRLRALVAGRPGVLLDAEPQSQVLFAVIGAEYILRMLPKTHDYEKFITPSELSQYIRSAGLEVQGFKGMGYNPLTKIYSLNDDTSVNYLVAARRPR